MKQKLCYLMLLAILELTSIGFGQTPYWDVNNPGSPGALQGLGLPTIPLVATNGTVYAVAWSPEYDGDQYPAYVYSWTKSNNWIKIVDLKGGSAYCLSIHNGDLYIGGQFTSVALKNSCPEETTLAITNIAVYNPATGACFQAGNVDDTQIPSVRGIVFDANQNMYIGTQSTNSSSLNSLMELEGNTWTTVGGGIQSDSYDDGNWGATALAVEGTDVYVGGDFAGGYDSDGLFVSSTNFIKWNGALQEWQAMGPSEGMWDGDVYQNWITSIVAVGSDVFVAGPFINPCDSGIPYPSPTGIAHFSTNGTWLDTSLNLLLSGFIFVNTVGANGYSLVAQNGAVYLGGSFDEIADYTNACDVCTNCDGTMYDGIAEWTNGSWQAVGSGVTNASSWGLVYGLAADSTNAIYVFGDFSSAGGMTCPTSGSARWVTGSNPDPGTHPTDTWLNTGSLITKREYFTATLLTNGDVLVAGGSGTNSLPPHFPMLTNSEVYSPVTGTWAGTGGLNTARDYHTATLLANGQVLVAGGIGSSNIYLSNAELYDPVAATWTTTNAMNYARARHTATRLSNGQVLVAGGYHTSAMASAELYDPNSGTWTNTGSLNYARYNHTATLLTNGDVLVVGGSTASGGAATAEIYDPNMGTWTLTNSITSGFLVNTATALCDGEVLIEGVTNVQDDPTPYAQLYNPNTGSWTTTGAMNYARIYDAATLTFNGQVLVTGGEINSETWIAQTEMYDPATGVWSVVGSLSTPLCFQTQTVLANGQVLVAGGANEDGQITSSAEVDY